MRIEQLKYLIEISRQRSLSLASETLHLTPQALSISIKKMEDEVGFKILERSPLSLTAEGEKLLAFSLEFVEKYTNLISELSRKETSTSRLSGNLTILYNSSFHNFILPATIPKYTFSFPKVTIHLEEKSATEIINFFTKSPLEATKDCIGLLNIYTDDFPEEIRSVFHPLFKNRLCACVHKLHPLSKSSPLSIKKILKHNLAIYSTNFPLQKISKYGKPMISFSCDKNTIIYNQLQEKKYVWLTTEDVFAFLSSQPDYSDLVKLTIKEDFNIISGYIKTNSSSVSNEYCTILRALPNYF